MNNRIIFILVILLTMQMPLWAEERRSPDQAAPSSQTGKGVSAHQTVLKEDIIISNEKIISSARNNLLGTIIKIEDNDSIIKMNVNVGVLFIVQITRKSFEEMGLNVGQEIYLTFKASSVRFI